MKKTKIFTLTLLLASLVVGCSKTEENIVPPTKGYLKIFTNNFGNEGSKISMNPSDPSVAAQWIGGEKIQLNNNLYTIAQTTSGDWGLKDGSNNLIEPLSTAMTAFYPGANFDGNDIEVTNQGIIMKSLSVRFLSDGKQSMAFPMVANSAADALALNFDHLSGGVQLTLHNGKSSAVNVASMTIVAQSTSAVTNLGNGTYTAKWAVEGPWVPLGPVGTNGDEVDVKYSSVMNFNLYDGSNTNSGKSIATGGDLQFCIPITINSMNYLKITGYDENGAMVFHVRKGFANAVTVERNRMYSLPTININ